MQPPPIVGTFWNQLESSGLLATPQLDALKRELPARGTAGDAEIARFLVQRKLLTQFQADRLLEGRSRGFFFDDYKILDIIGVGGMGWVYQAEQTGSRDIVALKVLAEQLQHDRGMLARFRQEARVGLRLHHSHIVRTDRLGSAGGQPYMVMELVEGPTLLELLNHGPQLSWKTACEFARQAALGLDHAHRQGIVHRDVKPQNLLIDRTGRVRLLDFGLSMVRDGEAGDEFSMAMIFGHQCVGTSEYVAPEQIDDSLAVDGRSDLYSLGGTLFAALTNRLPFQARDANEMLQAHRKQQPPSVRKYVPSIPVGVAEIVDRMLAKSPDQRYPTAAEAAEALAKWAEPSTVEFDFERILAERKRDAHQRYARLQKSRPTAPSLSGSTARPATASSITKRPPDATVTLKSGGSSSSSRALKGSSDEGRQREMASHQLNEAAHAGIPNYAPTPQSHAELVSLNTGRVIPINREHVVIGRNAECDLQLVDNAVSGRHCELRFDGFRWWITDLNSRNGTRVNGSTVVYQPLRSGDEIQIGNQLRFQWIYDLPGEKATRRKSWSRATILITVAAMLLAGLSLVAAWWLLKFSD